MVWCASKSTYSVHTKVSSSIRLDWHSALHLNMYQLPYCVGIIRCRMQVCSLSYKSYACTSSLMCARLDPPPYQRDVGVRKNSMCSFSHCQKTAMRETNTNSASPFRLGNLQATLVSCRSHTRAVSYVARQKEDVEELNYSIALLLVLTKKRPCEKPTKTPLLHRCWIWQQRFFAWPSYGISFLCQ